MRPSPLDANRQDTNDAGEQARRGGHSQGVIQTNLPPGVRSRSDDSWVEVSSQPSASSLSSATDEVVTTGLRVQDDANANRRRRRHPIQWQIGHQREVSAGGSSQEEYDESESESDRVMSSSNEGLQPSPLRQEVTRSASQPYYASSENLSGNEDEDDDENATAVACSGRSAPAFTPHPNAFTHPPASRVNRPQASSLPASRPSVRSTQRHSYPAQQQHTPYNAISPSHTVDHDAALRASLSTLLSVAAAARGSKTSQGNTAALRAGPSNRINTNTLGIVSESVALGEEPASKPTTVTSRTTSASRSPSADKHKRKAATTATGARSSSKDRRVVKKARRTSSSATPTDEVSPSLLTWVVSAGVVVLVSALSFSAGYVVGREAGRAEVIGELAGGVSGAVEAGSCGQEAISEIGRAGLGLRRFRWTGTGSGIRV